MPEDTKNPAAVELGKLGGKKTAERGPEYYAEINAHRKVRGGGRPKNPPKATHKGSISVGDVEIPCYVLEDGTRVITQRGMQTTIGMSTSGGTGGAHRTAQFVEQLTGKIHDNKDLAVRMRSPLVFYPPTGGMIGYGYEATVLIDVCDLILRSRDRNVLSPSQAKYAAAADIVIRAFAKVGIISVIDEATGYQEVRDKMALQAILDRFLRQELAAWAKRFPDEFYQQMFRLRGWEWKGMKVNRPQIVGHYTNDLVWERIAPGLRKELEERNPKDTRGRRPAKHHMWLTDDIGHPALAQHLYALLGLMRVCGDGQWDRFHRMVDRAFPKKGETLLLPYAESEA